MVSGQQKLGYSLQKAGVAEQMASPSFYPDVKLLVSIMEHNRNDLSVVFRQYPNFTGSHLTNGDHFLRLFDSDLRI